MRRLPTLPVVTPFCRESLGLLPGNATVSSSTIGTNNLGFLYPLLLESPIKIIKGFVINGSTASGNIDVGVYDSAFNRIVSHGGAAQVGTNTSQDFDITDTWLDIGEYWMAISGSNSGGTIYSPAYNDEVILAAVVLLEATAAYPLPSTLTPTKAARTSPMIACMGFTIDVTV